MLHGDDVSSAGMTVREKMKRKWQIYLPNEISLKQALRDPNLRGNRGIFHLPSLNMSNA